MKKYTLFLNNPEFTRNLWVNFSWIGFALTLFLIGNILLFAQYNFHNYSPFLNIYLFSFLCIVGFWGSQNVINAFLYEFKQGTWDYQRLSTVSPLQILLGKLFGAACMQWLLGVILFISMLIHFHFLPFAPTNFIINITIYWFIFSVLIILLQCNVVINFLLLWRKGSTKATRKTRSSSTGFIFLILGLIFIPWGDHNFWYVTSEKTIILFGFLLTTTQYVLIVAVVLTLWSLIALHNLLRSEFGQKISPLWWAGFLVFSYLFCYGTTFLKSFNTIYDQQTLPFFISSAIITAITIYVMLYYSKKDTAVWVRIGRYWQYGAKYKLFYSVPTWLISYIFMIILSMIACAMIFIDESLSDASRAFLIVLSFILFITRDICIVLYLNLSRRNNYLIVVFLLLYLSYPLNINIIPSGLFFPSIDGTAGSLTLALLSPLAQIAIIISLFKMNWNKFMPSFKE